MKNWIKILIVALCLTASLASHAQTTTDLKPDETQSHFSFSASLLTRGELRDGGMIAEEGRANPNDMAAFVVHRLRLPIDFSRGILTLHFAPQHTGIWGVATQGNFNLFEGWAELRSPKGLFLKVGRQALAYDDERIIGSDDWTMTAATHDVLKLGFEKPSDKLHLTLAFNQNGEKLSGGTFYENGSQPYKTMQLLWYHHDFKKAHLGLSLIAMNIGMQSGDATDYHTEYQQLVGSYLNIKPNMSTNIEASAYYQMGKEEHSIPISAWMASVKGTAVLDWTDSHEYAHWQIQVGYDYLSGDPYYFVPPQGAIGLPQHKMINGFSTVYGSHHEFYGAMEFFYLSTYYGGFTPGLQNLYIGGHYAPNKKLSFDAIAHVMGTATKVKHAGEELPKYLGDQVELTASWSPMPEVSLSAGYSFMRGSKTMEYLKRTDGNRLLQWAWLSLGFSPTLFKK